MKKLLIAIFSLFTITALLSGCSTGNDKPSNPNLENIKVLTETFDNGIQLDVYKLGVGSITKKYVSSMKDVKLGDPIVAVKYILTNKSNKPVDVKNVTLWNSNFKDSSKQSATFNFSDISLHMDFGTPTLPEEFSNISSSTWMLQPSKTATFAYDFLIDGKDMTLNTNLLFPNNNTFYKITYDLNKK